MLGYLVTSRSRRLLLELLWRQDASGSVSELAGRARIGFATAYRELKLMNDFGLVTVVATSGREVYAASLDHPEAALMRRLVISKLSSEAPVDEDAESTRRKVRSLGAPLAVEPAPVSKDEREKVIVEAVVLARRDATLVRALPVALWRQRAVLDRRRLKDEAIRSHTAHPLGFLIALTAELADEESLREWAHGLRDHRVRALRPFFELPSARRSKDLAERRTPEIAREWGYLMDLDLDSFRTTFDKHVRDR